MATPTPLRLLVDWSEEFSTGRRRESAMAATILHLLAIILILLSPKLFPPKRLTDEEARRQVAWIYLPSDVLKLPEPEPQPDLTPEERQRLTVRTPFTVDPRELALALPSPPPGTDSPGMTPEPSRGSAAGEEAAGSSPPAVTRLEDVPRPRTGDPGLEFPMSSPGRTIEESLRRGPSPGGSPGAPDGALQPNFNTPFPLILSDTRGVDFGPYLIRLLTDVRRNWYAVIPESTRWGEKGRVVIVFTVLKDGAVPQGQPHLVRSAGRSHLDRPALAAIRASQPFPPLPSEFTGDHIVLQFTFLYNLPLDYEGP